MRLALIISNELLEHGILVAEIGILTLEGMCFLGIGFLRWLFFLLLGSWG